MSDLIRLPDVPDPESRWQLPGGLEIAADSWGKPGRQLVLLLHGGGQTRHAWKGTGWALADAGYHAVAFDARGHGDSGWDPDAVYTQNSMVQDLVDIVEQLGDPNPVLVGASMGGGTSLVAIGEGRVAAAALVLVDVAPTVEPEGVENIRSFMYGNPEGFASLDDVAAAIAKYQPHRDAPPSLKGLSKNVRLGSDGRYYWHWDPRIPFGTADVDARRVRLEACVRRLNVPTLLVRGGLSDVLSEEGAASFRRLCPDAEYVNVADAAHMVAGDRNDAFATSVVDFLNRRVPLGAAQPPVRRPRAEPSGTSDDIVDLP